MYGETYHKLTKHIRENWFSEERYLGLNELPLHDYEFLRVGFNIEEMKNHCIVEKMLVVRATIPEHIYNALWDCANYKFPYLHKDEKGIITNKCHVDDATIEATVEKLNMTSLLFDIQMPPTSVFNSHQATVTPDITNTCIYDIVWFSDYLLKYFYRIFIQVNVLKYPTYKVKQQNYLYGIVPIDKRYHVSPITDRADFSEIIKLAKGYPTISLPQQSGKVSLHFREATYSVHDDVTHVHPVSPDIRINTHDGVPITAPTHILWYFKDFISRYYSIIREVFPIYQQLELVYKTCIVMAMRNKEAKQTVSVTSTHPDNVCGSGGIEFIPKHITISKDLVVKVDTITRNLKSLPFKVGMIHHSGLLLHTETETWILDYHLKIKLRPVNIVWKDVNSFLDGKHLWTVESSGQPTLKVDVYEIKRIMELVTKPTYNFITNNCHHAQLNTKKILKIL